MILVTGGAGYIGSHAVIRLLDDYPQVLIFDNLETGHLETVKRLQALSSGVKFVKGDLKNIDDIKSVFSEHKIESVVHFAASSLVSESVRNPQKYYYNNVLGSLNLFKSMIENNVMSLVFSSTCAVYGSPQYLPIDESHPRVPVNPYGSTKLTVENILMDYDKAYGLKSIILRYFNVAGADAHSRVGEWHDVETHLIPNILKSAFQEGKKFKIYGDDYDTADGTCIRDYVNVEDLAIAHKLALDYLNKQKVSDVFNLGSGLGNSVKEVFEISEIVLGRKIDCEISSRRVGDPSKLFASAEKAKSILGWNAEKDLEYSIKTAFEWEKVLQNILN